MPPKPDTKVECSFLKVATQAVGTEQADPLGLVPALAFALCSVLLDAPAEAEMGADHGIPTVVEVIMEQSRQRGLPIPAVPPPPAKHSVPLRIVRIKPTSLRHGDLFEESESDDDGAAKTNKVSASVATTPVAEATAAPADEADAGSAGLPFASLPLRTPVKVAARAEPRMSAECSDSLVQAASASLASQAAELASVALSPEEHGRAIASADPFFAFLSGIPSLTTNMNNDKTLAGAPRTAGGGGYKRARAQAS